MVSSLMLIVVERRETFHYYYPMGVHPPGDLTVTQQRAVGAYKSMKLIAANGFNPPMPLCARVG